MEAVKRTSTMVSRTISWSLLLLVLFLCQQLVVGYSNDGRKTFIVRVEGISKPTTFPTYEHWYRSIVASAITDVLETDSGTDMDTEQDNKLLHVYNMVVHGFSARLTEEEATKMGKTLCVLAMIPDRARQLRTTRSPYFLGLDTRNGSGYLGGFRLRF